MARTRMDTCRDCGAAILWGTTAAGKPMPLNAEKTADGEWLLDHEGVTVKKQVFNEEQGFTPHWATCTNPKKWRGSSREEQGRLV